MQAVIHRWLIAALLLLGATASLAEERAGEIRILAAWARATPGPTAAAYLVLRNEGAGADRLTGASSPITERIEIHEHRHADGVMRMAAIPDLAVPPGQEVRLAPGERHLMLFRINRPLRPGDRFELTLTFDQAGTVTVEAVTGGPGAVSPPP